MQAIRLEIKGDKVYVISPYHDFFVKKAKDLRGKWKDGAWVFDDTLLDYVREVMMKCYGTTGEVSYENCTLLISNYSEREFCGPVVLFSRMIAKAFGRDSNARLGQGIVFISGDYHAGGSVKNWTTEVENATFEIRDFPIPSLELPDVKKAIEEGWCTVKYPTKRRPKEEVEEEIEKLRKRIAELEAELAEE
jgi:hypothetical protein